MDCYYAQFLHYLLVLDFHRRILMLLLFHVYALQFPQQQNSQFVLLIWLL